MGIQTPWYRGQLCDDPHKHEDFFEIGEFSSYIECERKLRTQGLVHADGTLKMQLALKTAV
jgi:hypothetical protein